MISAKNEQALRAQALNLARLARSDTSTRPVDIAHALATTRTHFPHRAAVIATTTQDFTTALDDLAAGRPNPAVLDHVLSEQTGPSSTAGATGSLTPTGSATSARSATTTGLPGSVNSGPDVDSVAHATDSTSSVGSNNEAGSAALDTTRFAATRSGGTVFVFPGQGGQWPGMGRRLYAASPVFREHLDACAEALAPYTDWSLLDVLHQRDRAPSLDRVDVVQPALFAIMVALARLWEHHGIHPDAVIGHSQGEIAAAHIAGALSLEDAARVVAL
ncbi:acyltransferase domain-containing protein, partial [Nonomuraea sp. NPDC050643]|uniref:acyltransferase domain-containing protein n=1 Tax=Nonomuraea sp. NPDC050643 TaxID=3155660 RepID=UPI0033F02E49